MSKTKTYQKWRAMLGRCYNPNVDSYPQYGGRGITVAPRWQGSFTKFLLDMHECPEGLELDRIDVNGNYEPGNCRWAPPLVQARNKTTSRFVTHGNTTRTVTEWGEVVGIPAPTIFARLNRGWCIDHALGFALPCGCQPAINTRRINRKAAFQAAMGAA